MRYVSPRELTPDALSRLAAKVASPAYSTWALIHGEVKNIPGAEGPRPFLVLVDDEDEEEEGSEKAALLFSCPPGKGPGSPPVPYRVPLWENFVAPLQPKKTEAWLKVGTNWVAWARPIGPSGPQGDFSLVQSFPAFESWGVHYGILSFDLLVVWVEGEKSGPFTTAAVLHASNPEVHWKNLTCSGVTRRGGKAQEVHFYGNGGEFSTPIQREEIQRAIRALPQFGVPEGVIVVSALELACPV